jgi:ferrochelatase
VSPTGVLVLSHGTPAAREEVEGFYTRIRHGHPPTPALLDDLVRRYDAIGGLSPLTARTASQVRGLARQLDDDAPGRFVVENATKYATPSIEDAAERLVDAGVDVVVGVVLSPLHAASSTDDYHHRAEAAFDGRVEYRPISSWFDEPGFAGVVGRRLVEALAGTPRPATVAFTAHSLPTRTPGADEYAHELAALAAAVADDAGVHDYLVCWQSAGRTNDEWLGPGLLEVVAALDPLASPAIVVCPAGFVSDHLEVLYDLDIEATLAAAARGIALRRTRSLNDDPAFLAVLARLVERRAPTP